MQARETIHRLLHVALTEIGEDGEKRGNEFLLHMADLFRPLPLQLEQVARGQGSYDDVLTSLRQRAQQQGRARWLEHVIEGQLRWYSNESRVLVHRLLYVALIDIRMEAYDTQNEHVFGLADLFHDTPRQLGEVLKEHSTYDDVLASLRERALRIDWEEWLEQALAGASQSAFEMIQG